MHALLPKLLAACLILCITADHSQAAPKKEASTEASQASANPDRDYEIAQQAISDGIYTVAAIRARAFLSARPTSPQAFEVRRWLAESQLRQSHPQEALDTLDLNLKPNAPERPASLLILAQAQQALGQWEKAEATFRDILRQAPSDKVAADAQLSLAALMLQSRPQEGEAALRAVADSKPDDPAGQQAAITLARWLIARERFYEARTLLRKLIASQPKERLLAEAQLWLGEIHFAEKNTTDALAQFQLVTLNQQAGPVEIIARAWLQKGECEFLLSNWEGAAQSFEQAIRLFQDEGLRLHALRRAIDTARRAHQYREGLARLMRLFSDDEASNSPTAPPCLIAVGEAQLRDQQLDAAAKTFRQVIDTYPTTSWQGFAQMKLGELERRRNNLDKAYQHLRRATLNTNQEFSALARLRLALLLFENGKFDEARTEFLTLSENPAFPSAIRERSMFNALLTLSRQGKTKEYQELQTRFAKIFPKSLLQEETVDEQARLFAARGESAKAREIWENLLKRDPDTIRRPELLLNIARSYYREALYLDAIRTAELLLQEEDQMGYSTSARFVRTASRYFSKQITHEQALQDLEDIQASNPHGEDAPYLQFLRGQIAFEHQNYATAQARMVEFVKDWPNHNLADHALYFAGLSALNRSDWLQAKEILGRLAEEYPRSTRRWDGLTAFGHALRQQGKLNEAIEVYDSITEQKENPAAASLARLGKGDCLFLLATQNNKPLEPAIAAYESVLKTEHRRPEVINESGWKRGRALDKMGRKNEALNAWIDIVYNRILPPNLATSTTVPEYFWFGKAVLSAGELLEQRQDWRAAISLYRIAEQAGGPDTNTWRDRRLKVQRNHFIYE